MKPTKLAAVFVAAAAAVVPLSQNGAVLLPSTVFAEETDAFTALPYWIPTDFESATEFRNIYGATHIDNGLICIVFPERVKKGSKEGTFNLQVTPDMGEILKHELYTHDYTETCFHVFVYQPEKKGELTLQIVDTNTKTDADDLSAEPRTVSAYTFLINPNISIAETDIFSWLPDSMTEYNNYIQDHGEVSVKDNYVLFCTRKVDQFGDKWEPDSSNKYENIKYLLSSDCTMQVPDLYDDGSTDIIYVYQTEKDGYDKISWIRTSDARPDAQEPTNYTLTADCVVLDNAQTILMSEQTRVTVTDAETGKLLPDKALASDPFRFHADIVYKPDLYSSLSGDDANYTIIKNNSVLQERNICPGLSSLAKAYKKADLFKITTEEPPEITYYENGAMDLAFKLKTDYDLPEGATRITLYDKDTGELIPSEVLEHHIWQFGTDIRLQGGLTGPIYVVTSNPQIYETDLARLYKSADSFAFLCDDQPEVIYHGNDSMDLVFRTKVKVSGDMDGDGEFSNSDVSFLENWLIGISDAEAFRWEEADFNLDNQLNAIDLSLMKRELLKNTMKDYVEPDEQFEWGTMFFVNSLMKNGLKLYAGPDESYAVLASIPVGTRLMERGYQKDLNDWIFTEYNGQFGWLKTVAEDGETPTVYYEAVPAKPVIYLYPEQETDVHIELELTEADLNTTYPKYNDGWDVTAYPDGTLLNKADGSHHKYLFWDAVNCRTRFDFSEGFCIAGADTERFLKEKLTYMGLTEEEMNEFIVYWLPLMEHNKYNLIAFQGDAYTNSAKLTVTPTPDSECRVFMAYIPLEEPVEIAPQQLDTFERKGFAVVEWGGVEIKSIKCSD